VVDEPDLIALERLGTYVRQDRIQIGYRKLKDFADDLDISVQTIGKLERGTEQVSPATMVAVEQLLNWLVGDCQRVLTDPKYRPTIRRPSVLAGDLAGIKATKGADGEPLARRLRALYLLLGETEFLQTCLRLGRGTGDQESTTSTAPTN
jgi:DNA-binding XRE family transcriptional regulator